MSSRRRRFEVLLPLQFNDGRGVSPEWLAEAVLQIVVQSDAEYSMSEYLNLVGFTSSSIKKQRDQL